MTEAELFEAALDLPDAAARAEYLDRACADSPDLRARVEALLHSHEMAGSFLGTPAVGMTGGGVDLDPAETTDINPALSALHATRSGMSGSVPRLEADDELRAVLEPSTRPDSLGRLGHYEVLQVLGRGAFGVVLRAFDDVLQRVVAIKMMITKMAATSPARRRFLREARAAAAVRHENVVQIYEVVEQPIPYLVMEFIPGETLQQRIDRIGPLDVNETLAIGRQIAEGLAAAHGNDLTHRDVKPGNILIEGGTRRVKITDFGLARTADDASITQSGMITGTPLYMAPEQAMGRNISPRADLFSLGSVLYHMVTGRAPFRANTTLAVMKRVAEDTPRPLREIIPETPQWLADIIAKLHAKDPSERFASAREVADVLADCEAQLKTNPRLRDFSRIPRGRRPVSGWQRRAAMVAVLLLPVLALAVTELTGVTDLLGRTPAAVITDPAKPGHQPAPTPVSDPRPAESEGWVQLFNRKDLAGWKTHSDEPGNWQVKDGILIGSEARGFLFTERGDFRNFHLRAEVKINERGDGGLFFRAGYGIRRGTEPWQFGPAGGYETEIQKNPTHGRPTGSVMEVPGDARPTLLGLSPDDSLTRPNEWFTLEIKVEKNHFITAVNGRETANCADPLDTHPDGHLALQVWSTNTIIQFRKIEIRELPRTTPAPVFPDSEIQRIAALPAAQQVEEVRKALIARNPGFDGEMNPAFTGDVVTGLSLKALKVTDLSPLRALIKLQTLSCTNGPLSDLTPLTGMPLTTLDLESTEVHDLTPLAGMPLNSLSLNACPLVRSFAPLKGMPLVKLNLRGTAGADLSPLAGMQLSKLNLGYCRQVQDLSPLKGMPLVDLYLYKCQVRDLEPLRGMPLKYLFLADCTPLEDLSPLKGMSLVSLNLNGCPQLRDLGPLEGMELKSVSFTGSGVTDLSVLRTMQSLETINAVPATEFWDSVK